jgi:hypothetical protein
MAKKTTLKEIGDMLAHVVKHMATREDLEKLATKDQIIALHTQVSSIEAQLERQRREFARGRIAGKRLNRAILDTSHKISFATYW